MTQRTVPLAVVVLFLGAIVAGQEPAVTADPISGSWGFDGRTLLEVEADGTGGVSGTGFFYGGPSPTVLPIRRGTFDRATGALRVEGDVTLPGASSPSVWVIEGTLADGVLQVAMGLNGASQGTRTLTRMTAAAVDGPVASAPGTVLITGSNRGLGFEFARQYAERGWTVIATVRNPEAAADLRDLAAKTGRITIERLDVLDRPAITALAARYRGRPIDLLINNAGIGGNLNGQTLGSFDPAVFEETMAVNVYGALAMAEAFREHVAASRHRKIVSITSGWAIFSLPRPPGPYFYRASKAALNMVMKALADDLRAQGVIVALVAPGAADTELRRQLQGNSDAPPPAGPVAAMIRVIDGLTLANSGTPLNFDGTVLPW